jgi:type I restriction enzyme, S subunit
MAQVMEKMPKVLTQPRLRYQSFKDDWKVEQLGEMLMFKNGVNAEKEHYGSGYKFINVLDILQNDFITHDVILGAVELSEADFKKNEVVYGDILFQRSSETREEVGQANVYLDKKHTAAFGGFVIRGRAKKEYSPEFMNYLLRTDKARQEITTKSGGSTRYNVGQEVLEGVSVILPTLPEQQKIAAFLGAVDRKIQQLKRKQELLERYKKGVVQQLFSQELRFKIKGRGGELVEPPEWEEKRLGDIATKKASALAANELPPSQGDYPVFGASGYIRNADFFREEEAYIAIVKDGAGVGRNFLCPPKSSVLGTLDVIASKGEERIEYIYYVLQQLDFKKYITGSTIPHIYFRDYSKESIMVPCLEEQTRIAGFLMALDAKVAGVAQAVVAAQKWKKGLLQQMFV